MGLDIGDSRIGVALSDPMGIMASPWLIIKRSDESTTISEIHDIIREKEVGKVIVGLPLNMDGSRGTQAEKTVSFVDALRRHLEVPIEYQDERLSTVSAQELIKGIRRTTRHTRYDAAAAALILQSYLEKTNPRTNFPTDPDLLTE